MVGPTFREAVYRDGNTMALLKICDLTKPNYQKNYRGHLFCPTKECTARLMFVSRLSGTKYFASIDVNEHQATCPHRKETRENQQDDGKVSDQHIKSSIKYFMERKLLNEEEPLIDRPQTRKAKRKRGNEEEHIRYVSCEQLKTDADGDILCVGGIITSVHIKDNEKVNQYAFFNFSVADKSQKVSVKISPTLYYEDKKTAGYVQRLKKKVDAANEEKDRVILCTCYGRIWTCEKGFNVIPKKLLSIYIATKRIDT